MLSEKVAHLMGRCTISEDFLPISHSTPILQLHSARTRVHNAIKGYPKHRPVMLHAVMEGVWPQIHLDAIKWSVQTLLPLDRDRLPWGSNYRWTYLQV